PAPAPVPGAVAAGPPGASPGPGHVPSEDGCLGVGGGAGSPLRGGCPVAESSGPRRGRSRGGAGAVLRPAEARGGGAAHVERIISSCSETAIQRVTGIIWQLPRAGLSTDRDHLTPGP